VLRKKFANQDEEYDSTIGVTQEAPPELTPSTPAQYTSFFFVSVFSLLPSSSSIGQCWIVDWDTVP